MVRLHFVVEGQTEEEFVNAVLADHLGQFQISSDARCVETSRTGGRIHRGGLPSYFMLKKDLRLWMKEDKNRDAWFTTMLDLYRLPNDFPGYERARTRTNPHERVALLEEALQEDIGHPRFIPYLQLHEFEALILVEPERLADEFIGQDRAVRSLMEQCDPYPSPEEIDDGAETAPSKLIAHYLPAYLGRKASAGPRIAAKIGVAALRQKCPHFDQWLRQLEGMAA